MITVYYRKVFSNLEDGAFERHLNKVEEARREKILRLKSREEQMRSLTAGCLLHAVLCEKMCLSASISGPFQMEYQEKGKPFLTNRPDIHFNLSHSGSYVCCAAADEPVGVDIEKKADLKEKIAKRFFTWEDNQRLLDAKPEEKKDLFFRMWSIKESYIKFTGQGMTKGLSSFEIDWKINAIFEKENIQPAAYFSEKKDISGYSFCVCFQTPGQEVIWHSMDAESPNNG